MNNTNQENCFFTDAQIKDLRPMSRLDFQILYGKCASSGWVHGEFNETLYQQYLQRYGFFLCHIIFLKTGGEIEVDGILTNLKQESDIFFLEDKSGLIHTISLPKTKNLISDKVNSKIINWFFAESPNTIDTYVYKPSNKKSAYYTGPLQIIESNTDWLESAIVLLDFFPFPIIMSTDIRKEVVDKGYTFRKHLSEYFKPLFLNVKKFLQPENESVEVYLISPPYTSIHAIFELEDFEWKRLIKLKAESKYKKNKKDAPFGFDNNNTPKKIYDGYLKIKNNEYNEFLEKFDIDISLNYKINVDIPPSDLRYSEFCAYLKQRIYLNDSNVPGIPTEDKKSIII
jgi:hypothetical protein